MTPAAPSARGAVAPRPPAMPSLAAMALGPFALLAAMAALVPAAGAEEPPATRARPVWADAETNALGAPSPDGRYLSYVDAAGNLAIRDLESGRSRALTRDAGGLPPGQFAYFSVFSPDSRRVAYAWFNEDGFYELRIVGLDDSAPRTVYRNPEAGFVQPTAFTPDGRQILTLLFRRDNVSQIAFVPADGGTARVLRSLDWFYPKKVDLSPDGRFIVYDSMPGGESAPRDIHILAADGSTHGTLTDDPADDLFPLWTPDGRAVVFGSDRLGSMDAWMVPVANARAAGEPGLVHKDLGRALPMAFTRDGRLFYGLRAGRSDVFVAGFHASTGALTSAATAAGARFEGANRNPEWSPDGRYLAYLSRVGTENYGKEHRAVTVLDLRTGREAVFSPRLAFLERLRWSPDGSQLLLAGSDAQGRSGLFAMGLDTGEATSAVVERGGDFRGMAGDWSASGSAVFFVPRADATEPVIRAHHLDTGKRRDVYRPASGTTRIRSLRRARGRDALAVVVAEGQEGRTQSLLVVDAAAGTAESLLHSRYGEISGVEWMPGDRELLVTTESSGGSALWTVALGKAEPRQLAAPWKRPGPVRISPDGARVAYSAEERKSEVWALENLPPPAGAGAAEGGGAAAPPPRRAGGP